MARRPVRGLVIAGVVVLAAVAAFFVGDAIARAIVQDRVRDTIVSELALPSDQRIDVAVGGLVIPQLVVGRLDDVHVAAEDVALEGLSGDIEGDAHGVPTRGDDVTALGATATIRMDAEDVDALLATAGGEWTSWGDVSVALPGPAATFSAEINVFGASLPLEFSAVPGVSDGDVVVVPDAVRIGDLELDAASIAQAPVDLSALAQPLTVCRGDTLPSGVEVTAADVSDERLVIRLALADGFLDGIETFDAAICA
ncbi:LmeA family phospholipid-binding protein [Microbacterium betulae]|uniref:LmeA family phospholipid-binding protein n=1 Tax=Microbacterium betulae TaxID=2981139 RepID=A0AA97FH05_9MICO|nr:LmeA family phospholipid-binding protein [Microbacterium sp. AB]WOF22130.1 LmeA family phospholipid-binding protein [Microbacterium sp. AB]